MKVARRVAIVTGAASGVGAATARRLAAQDYNVLVNYRGQTEAAAGVVADCRSAGADAVSMAGDVADDAACVGLVQEALARWGRIDALVNSAGTTRFVPMPDLDAVQAADFERMNAVNAVGPFQMARAAARHMGEGGAIVNVSSISAQTGNGSSIPYLMSKAALNALTLALARVLAPRIRVNAVLPGMIEGRWMREGLGVAAYERVKAQFADSSLLGRVARPEDVAASVCWLLEPGGLMTGQLVVVDGGATLGRPPAAAATR